MAPLNKKVLAEVDGLGPAFSHGGLLLSPVTKFPIQNIKHTNV